MGLNQIPLIMERLDKIVTEDRARKYTTALTVNIIAILKFYNILYRYHPCISSTTIQSS